MRKMADDPCGVIHDPVRLRDQVSVGNISNLFAQVVQTVSEAPKALACSPVVLYRQCPDSPPRSV